MSADEPENDDEGSRPNATDVKERLEESADRAVSGFDEGIVDLLSWVLDTETRARIYAQLRQHPHSTSDEIAEGTGLYPSTVREALADLHDEDKVERRKRESDGAGNNPYEYAAIAPSELVGTVVDDVQAELNTVFNLDRYLNRGGDADDPDAEPVTINVDEAGDENGDADASAGDDAADDADGDADDE